MEGQPAVRSLVLRAGLSAELARYSSWLEKVGIKDTPMVFVNGYQLPGQYRVEDLSHLVAGFSEQIPVNGENRKEAEIGKNY